VAIDTQVVRQHGVVLGSDGYGFVKRRDGCDGCALPGRRPANLAQRVGGVLLALAVSAGSADAQSNDAGQAPAPAPAGTGQVAFLPRFDFHVSLEHLFREEIRYVWDAHFGGDLDIVDYGVGRFTFVADYETVLGNEYRAFDPTQGNYILEGAASGRVGEGLEIAGVFHHVSRHLSDRPKRQAVDWNMVGARVRGHGRGNRVEWDGRADLRGVIQNSFVDYTWEFETVGLARVPIRPRVAVSARGAWRVVGVDGTRARGTQIGYRAEAGLHLAGDGAEVELFVAGEQRIDPYQLEFGSIRWMTAGFRISSPGPPRVP
jgi:hypothetical protein